MPAVCICGSQIASGQNTFMMTYGGTGDEEGRKLIIRSDGNIQIAGWSESFSVTKDIYVLTINQCGLEICSSVNGGKRNNLTERGLSLVEVTLSDRVFYCGDVNAPANTGRNFYLYSTDLNNCNKHQSNRLLNFLHDDYSRDITTFYDGDDFVISCGFTTSFSASTPRTQDFYLYKFNVNTGSDVFYRWYGSQYDERAEAILAHNRIYYLSGFCFEPDIGTDNACLLSVNYATGAVNYFYLYSFMERVSGSWDIEYTPSSGLDPVSMDPWPEGIILVGSILDGLGETCTPSKLDVLLVRLDLAGNIIWAKAYGDCESDEEGYEVITDSDQNFVVAGYTKRSGVSKGVLMKVDPNGDLITSNFYTSEGSSVLFSVRQFETQSYFSCGWANGYSHGGDKDLLVLRTDDVLQIQNCFSILEWEQNFLNHDFSIIEPSDTGITKTSLFLLDTTSTVIDSICHSCN